MLLQQHLQRDIGPWFSTKIVRNPLHNVGLYAVRHTNPHWRLVFHLQWINVQPTVTGHRSMSDGDVMSSATHSPRTSPASAYKLTICGFSRQHGRRNNPAFLNESVRFDGRGIMIWAGISINGASTYTLLEMGQQRFWDIDEILRPNKFLYHTTIGDKSIFIILTPDHIVLT